MFQAGSPRVGRLERSDELCVSETVGLDHLAACGCIWLTKVDCFHEQPYFISDFFYRSE